MKLKVLSLAASVSVAALTSAQAQILTGKVFSVEEPAMEGVLVSVKKEGSTIATTVVTNDKGEFTLTSSTGKKGAMMGTHEVSISALDAQVGDRDTRPPRGGWPLADKVPSRYNSKSEIQFAVPASGIDKSDFELTTP